MISDSGFDSFTIPHNLSQVLYNKRLSQVEFYVSSERSTENSSRIDKTAAAIMMNGCEAFNRLTVQLKARERETDTQRKNDDVRTKKIRKQQKFNSLDPKSIKSTHLSVHVSILLKKRSIKSSDLI